MDIGQSSRSYSNNFKIRRGVRSQFDKSFLFIWSSEYFFSIVSFELDALLPILCVFTLSRINGLWYKSGQYFVCVLQHNMLLPFIQFYEAFSIHMDFEAAGTQLSDFVQRHKSVCVFCDFMVIYHSQELIVFILDSSISSKLFSLEVQ